MKKTTMFGIPVAAAALALGAAAPASAARYDNANSLRSDIAQLDRQIDRALDKRQITRREAVSLEAQVDGLQRDFRSYSRGGFERWEVRALDRGISNVRRQLTKDLNDRGNGRDNRPANYRDGMGRR